VVRPDGEVRVVRDRWFLIRGQTGTPYQIAGFAEDVPDHNRTEIVLRESEARYRLLFTSIDEVFCTVEVLFDVDGKPFDYRFLEVNPAFERQIRLENAIGKTSREFALLIFPITLFLVNSSIAAHRNWEF
jgi:PAS domain-containing protein